MTATDYNEFHDPDFKIDLVINDVAEVYLFHNKPFRKAISWLEFDIDSKNLDIIMGDGEQRSFGVRIPDRFARHMQNAFQVMMVLMDKNTGKPSHGDYFPLIIHRA